MFSINAIGTIDKKLIYRKRKGFDDVKKYTKTVNPDLPGQKTQKGYFKEAISEWVTAGYSSTDVQAWNLYARSKKVITSGFNRFTGLRINAEREGKTWEKITNCIVYDITGEGFKVDVNVEGDYSGKLYLGTSKFSMLQDFVGVFSVDKYTFEVTGLSKETKYYFYVRNEGVGKEGRTGIYNVKTVTTIPILIDIGSPVIDRVDSFPPNYTVIVRENPANANGKIEQIKIWAFQDMTGVKVATFFLVSGSNYSTRDWDIIGNVAAGAERTFPVDINVVAGDLIGYYGVTGRIEKDNAGPMDVGYYAGDHIPCINQIFNVGGTQTISLNGTGSS